MQMASFTFRPLFPSVLIEEEAWCCYGHCGEQKNVLLVSGLEPRTTPTDITQLQPWPHSYNVHAPANSQFVACPMLTRRDQLQYETAHSHNCTRPKSSTF